MVTNIQLEKETFTFIDLTENLHVSRFAEDIQAGLSASQKHLPAKHLYDETGSSLFERITSSDDYYLTRVEETILQTQASAILDELPADAALVELGSGNSAKTRRLLEVLVEQQKTPLFVPIDISRDFLFANSQQLVHDYPGLHVMGIAADYHDGLEILTEKMSRPCLILWLGSDIGHTDYANAAEHLKQEVVPLLKPRDRLLLGIDLKKPNDILHAAYGCGQQTETHAASQTFALNLLHRINREFGGNFDTEAFEYQCGYDREAGCIAVYIVSLRSQSVTLQSLNLTVTFEPDEHIRIHRSYKYDHDDIRQLADASGLHLQHQWLDSRRWFSLNLLAPAS